MEFVHAWRQNFDSMKRQRLFRVFFVLAICLLIYVLIALRQIEASRGNKAHWWLFAIYFAVFLVCAELFKAGFGRRKVE